MTYTNLDTTNSRGIIKEGDIANNKHFQIVLVNHGDLSTGTQYSVEIPKLLNPNNDVNLNFRIYSVKCVLASLECHKVAQKNLYSYAQYSRNLPSSMTASMVNTAYVIS